MPNCECHSVRWKNRPAYRISNGLIELTVLLGGGHIVDLRLSGSPLNIMWEAPWQTIDPHTFSSTKHEALYGDQPVGKFLSGYSGHALVLGYFGLPSAGEAAEGLPLHGEAASAQWTLISMEESDESASLALEVELPVYQLNFRRKITLRAAAPTAAIDETVVNDTGAEISVQWVQHAAFGEPFYTKADASLFVPVSRAVTWPLGYENHEFLPANAEFTWPIAPTANCGQADLRIPFQQQGTGFIVSLLMQPERSAYLAIHNRHHQIIAGYHFDRSRFPWIALWEENCARSYPPWNGTTQVRGVEFGTSPMPLGLDQAREVRSLYDTPVLTSIPARAQLKTSYEIFVSHVSSSWKSISDVAPSDDSLIIRDEAQELRLKSSRIAHCS
jgi:Domain of unknown function (DUF4432)